MGIFAIFERIFNAIPFSAILLILLIIFAVITLFRIIIIVPNKTECVIERLGKYSRTLGAGMNLLVPFIDKVRYTHNLKEQAIDVPAQECFTKDNVRVRVDGVLYMRVFDSVKASYGIVNYKYATILLAQTTMRSVIGLLDLDDTFEARDQINARVVKAVDEASDPWGIKVTRYEIQNITVSHSIMEAMENQMKAEREKRAEIARSVGQMETMVNLSRAAYEEAVNISQGEKERMINIAEGQAREIIAIAQATAEGIRKIAEATNREGGNEAAQMSIANKWIGALGNIEEDAKIVLSADITDVNKMTRQIAKTIFENS